MKRSTKIKAVIILSAAAIAGTAALCYAAGKKSEEEEENTLKTQQKIVKSIYTEAYQNNVEERLEKAKQSGDYTEDAMLVEQNPYGTNTLSLYVYFKTEDAVSVSYTVSVKEDSIVDFSAVPSGEENYGTEHEFQVIGLIPDCKNTITFTLTGENGEERTCQYEYDMGSLAGEEEVQLEKTDLEETAEAVSDGLYVILGNDSDGLDFMYYYDNSGVLRGEIPLIGYRSHRLLFQDGLMYYSISESKIAAVNALGMAEQIYDTEQYELHHDYVFDDDGNILVLATDTEADSVEDQIIRINRKTGEITHVLDLAQLFGNYKATCSENDDGELDWMHINTIQWLGNDSVILSSRETSTILKISNLYEQPKVDYMIGETTFWNGTGYENLLLSKDESAGAFSNTGGQHTVTYQTDEELPDGEYYLYMFNNNYGVSKSQTDYDWEQIDGIEASLTEGKTSYFYKYKVNEQDGTYSLIQSFEVPFSAYVSSAQEYGGNIIIDSGMKGIFGEYDLEGNLIRQFKMKLADEYIYRVYKYDFSGFYFAG